MRIGSFSLKKITNFFLRDPKIVSNAFASAVTGIGGLLALGSAYQFAADKIAGRKMPPSPGKLVDIGGYRLHIHEIGEGKHTVILDAGMSHFSLNWFLAQPEIARFAKVVSYDRGGLGWSDNSPYPRDSEHLVSELHTLLRKADISGPYILVGHSIGGINARLFAGRYPNEAAGLILVDASHEDQTARLPANPMPELSDGMFNFMVRFGILRLLGHFSKNFIYKRFERYPENVRNIFLNQLFTTRVQFAMKAENEKFEESCRQLKKRDISLGGKPLTVITAGTLSLILKNNKNQEWFDATYEEWKVLQKELVALSNRGKQMIATKSGHLIPHFQPEIIVRAVREMIDELDRKK